MNKFSLSFQNRGLEEEFQQLSYIQDKTKFRLYIYVLYMVVFSFFLYNIINEEYSKITVNLIQISCVFVIHFMIIKLKRAKFSYLILAANVGFSAFVPILQLLNYDWTTETYSHYYIGQLTCYFQVSFTSHGHLFPLKVLSITFNVLLQFTIMAYSTGSTFPILRWDLILAGALYIVSVYFDELHRRQRFLIQKEQLQWERNYDDFQELIIFKCRYNEEKNTVNLLSINEQGRTKLNISDENKTYSFNNFIRNTVIYKDCETVKQFVITKEKISLETMIIKIDTQPQVESQFYQLQKNQNKQVESYQTQGILFNYQKRASGQFQDKVFTIKIHMTYDFNPFIVVMLKQKGGYDSELFSYIEKIKRDFSTEVWKLVLQTKHLLKSFNNIPKRKKVLGDVSKLYYDLSNYHSFLNPDKVELELTKFQLVQEIQFLIEQISVLSKKYKIRIYLDSQIDSLTQVYTDSEKLKNILFNLLKNSLTNSPQNSVIILRIQEAEQMGDGFNSYKITIIDQGSQLNEETLKQLPIINPKFMDQIQHNSKNQLRLGLSVSSFLLNFIGSDNNILISTQPVKKISFGILQMGTNEQKGLLKSELPFDPRIHLQIIPKNK